MRVIEGKQIIEVIKKLCIKANTELPEDVRQTLQEKHVEEKDSSAKDILTTIMKNADVAYENQVAMCQDTGMAVVFVEIGQNVQVVGGSIEELINEGVRQGYTEGFLRKSVVSDPVGRENTKDNTPAVIHYQIVPGENLKLTVAPKGFGSENMSKLYMLKPSEGVEGIKTAIIETVIEAGPNPCPPIVVGVGLGGTFERAAYMAKKALMRDLGTVHEHPVYGKLEKELLDSINALGIGPQGFGGTSTALGVHIEYYPTHIAGLPVAINIGCHASRHASWVL